MNHCETRVIDVRRTFAGLLAWAVACLLATGFAKPPTANAAEKENPAPNAGPFAAAIAYANQRTVQVYGAGIGREPGYASGLIVSAQGHILTAQGVYLAAERLRVVLPDGSEHLAKVERRSVPLQAVLLKIEAATPQHFILPEKGVARKGDWVLSVSNAFKVAVGREKPSVNLGIVSLRTELDAKRGTQDVHYEGDVLLIDAITSNPGAPGGALVGVSGELVGMIGKIIEGRSTNTRLNYAVPADLLQKFVAGKLLAANPIEPPPSAGEKVDLGIRIFRLGGKKSPAYVDRVLPNSLAAKAGIKPDDLVVTIGDETVRDVEDYLRIEATLAAGQPIVLGVKRKVELLEITIGAGDE